MVFLIDTKLGFLPTPHLAGKYGVAWKPQTGTSVGASQFWPQRGRPREAGAVQSSTTRCWSRKHGCPSARLGQHHCHLHSKASFCRLLYVCGILRLYSVQTAWNEWNSAEEILNPPEVESGNRWGLVYPVNSFRFYVIESMIPAVLKQSSSKGLKKIRLSGMSSSELLMLPATVPMGRSVQWKNFIQAFAGTSLWRKRCSASLTCQQYFLVSYGYIQVTSIYMKYTCNIHNIYNVYPLEIFCIYSLNLFDMHGICMKNAMFIHTIYLLYTWHIQCISN